MRGQPSPHRDASRSSGPRIPNGRVRCEVLCESLRLYPALTLVEPISATAVDLVRFRAPGLRVRSRRFPTLAMASTREVFDLAVHGSRAGPPRSDKPTHSGAGATGHVSGRPAAHHWTDGERGHHGPRSCPAVRAFRNRAMKRERTLALSATALRTTASLREARLAWVFLEMGHPASGTPRAEGGSSRRWPSSLSQPSDVFLGSFDASLDLGAAHPGPDGACREERLEP